MADTKLDDIAEDLADFVVMILHCDGCGNVSDDSDRATPMSAAEELAEQGWRFINTKVLCPDCAKENQ